MTKKRNKTSAHLKDSIMRFWKRQSRIGKDIASNATSRGSALKGLNLIMKAHKESKKSK